MRTSIAAARKRALDWVAANLKHFDPRRASSKGKHVAVKVLAEALLVAELASPRRRKHPAIVGLENLAHVVWEDKVYQSRALRNPHLFRIYAAPLAFLCTRSDHTISSANKAIVSQLLASGYAEGVAEVPFQELDGLWTLDRLGHPRSTRFKDLLDRSIIGRRLAPAEYSRTDAYNFTHLVFYSTDWGRRAWRGDARSLAYVCASLGILIPIWVARSDWDLVGELLIAAAVAGVLKSPIGQHGLRRYLAAQRRDGTFPIRASKNNFSTLYHPVLVCCLLTEVVASGSVVAASLGDLTRVRPSSPIGLRKRALAAVARTSALLPRNSVQRDCLEAIRALTELLREGRPGVARRKPARRAPHPLEAESNWDTLAALASGDLQSLGQATTASASAGSLECAEAVLLWLLARQDPDGHFGCLEPERLAVKARIGNDFDFDSRVRWPSTAAAVAAIVTCIQALES